MDNMLQVLSPTIKFKKDGSLPHPNMGKISHKRGFERVKLCCLLRLDYFDPDFYFTFTNALALLVVYCGFKVDILVYLSLEQCSGQL